MEMYSKKATTLKLTNIKSMPIRTFWITSVAFFICFFAWFGIVPFMPDVVRDLGLTPDQKWNSIVLAVTGTVFARLVIGKLCDRFGPRLCYTYLLLLGAIPVILIGFCTNPIAVFDLQTVHRFYRSLFCNHAVSYQHYVRTQYSRYGQCHLCGMGKFGRWSEPSRDALDCRCCGKFRCC